MTIEKKGSAMKVCDNIELLLLLLLIINFVVVDVVGICGGVVVVGVAVADAVAMVASKTMISNTDTMREKRTGTRWEHHEYDA